MVEVTLEKFRETCECWEEDDGCLEDYPEECPFHENCQKESENPSEELVPA